MPEPVLVRRALAGAAMVLEMAVLSVGGLLAGAWLDRRFGTDPAFLALGTLLGFAGGLSRLLFLLSRHHDPPPGHRR